jgi:hypothetical protein
MLTGRNGTICAGRAPNGARSTWAYLHRADWSGATFRSLCRLYENEPGSISNLYSIRLKLRGSNKADLNEGDPCQ